MGGASVFEVSDSTLGFVETLIRTGGWMGACFVVLFAIVVPIIKLVLLAVGELWRTSEDPVRVKKAGLCITIVQLVSKWACPDMFAYVLLLYLIRSLNKGETMQGLMSLDAGFTCFSLFCISTTVSSLG